jgi:O-6-methylguanine DNA methyltransferase|tara:strand:- start:222 stop:545 length:324 start_codon:yes stop_codon:yes gene_type:complete
VNDVKRNVYELTKRIPAGRVTTYGEIARALDKPRAARLVGKILHDNPTPIIVPCHRVVMADGSLGGYQGGIHKKIKLLESEGVSILDLKVVNVKAHLFLYPDNLVLR